MTTLLLRSLLPVFVLLIGLSCSRPEPAPADPIANTQWYGTFSYTGETLLRVFTIQFGKDNAFVWQDLSGSYSGRWTRTDNDVTISFTVNNIQTRFQLVGTNQLTNPKNLNHTTWTVKQLARIESEATLKIGTVLPKTNWAGSLLLAFDADNPNTLVFRPGAVTYYNGRGDYTTMGPVLQVKNAHWNATYSVLFFGVFINEQTLIGNFQQKSLADQIGPYKPLPLEEFTRK
ncbi:hypothetical protein [uncultured Spirosoma sp.]|uniref:hypothetical protein n=1 Tax=uncultured Spirosoma sp. TaxID=278208 RepID=UPI00258CCA89|nr:hypothetical protein [uncultured Spirosoma sp.]